MPQWSDLHPAGYPLLQRLYFDTPGAVAAFVAPAKTAYVRVSVSAAGGFCTSAAGWGGGSAFAFSAEACAPGASFTAQVGDSQFAKSTQNTSAGDSWVKRADTSVLAYADRGRPDGSPGLAANSTGDIVRDGGAATSIEGGAAAGDDVDDFPLGFGGRGSSSILAPWYGGGGGRTSYSGVPWYYPANDGRICVEFYREDPGYD